MNYLNNIFIINLDKDKDRFENATKQLSTLNLNSNRFPALNYCSIDKQLISKYCSLFCTKGMLGCASSHYEIWKMIVKNNLDYCVIFEDDIILDKNFLYHYNEYIKSVPNNWDMILLGCVMKCNSTNKFDIYEHLHSLLFFKKFGKNTDVTNNTIRIKSFVGTHAYILSKKGAQKLLDSFRVENGHLDVDISLFLSRNKEFYCYAFKKEIVFQSNKLFLSNINTNKQPFMVNYYLDKISIRKDRDISFAYILNEHIGAYQGINFNIILLLFLLSGLAVSWYNFSVYLIFIFLILEMIFISYKRINIDINNCSVYLTFTILFLLGYYIGKIIRRKI